VSYFTLGRADTFYRGEITGAIGEGGRFPTRPSWAFPPYLAPLAAAGGVFFYSVLPLPPAELWQLGMKPQGQSNLRADVRQNG